MKRLFLLFLLILLLSSNLHASQSTIVEVDGQACMGYDKSRKQTEDEALTHAKKKAVQHAATYIKSESRVKDFELEKDLVEAYSNATVKVIQELSRTWYRDVSLGDCCQVKIKAEVILTTKRWREFQKEKVRRTIHQHLSMFSSGRIRRIIRKRRRSRFLSVGTNPSMPGLYIREETVNFYNSFPTLIEKIITLMEGHL